MAFLNPYLNFNGNVEEAFEFYKSIFGTAYQAVMRFKEAPTEYRGLESEAEKIMHITLPIGGGTVLMGCDIPGSVGHAITGTNFHICIDTENEEEADKLFKGLSAGGQVFMPMQKAFWGSYFGMLKDKFAIQWMISYAYNH